MSDVQVSPDGRSSTYSYGSTGTGPSATELANRAIERMSAELDPYDAARNLVERWVSHDSSLSHLRAGALLEIEAREKRSESQGGKKRAKQRDSAVRVGDVALIVGGMGPNFYRVNKIVTDTEGKTIALTLSDPASNNTGQPVEIGRITAIFRNELNTQETHV